MQFMQYFKISLDSNMLINNMNKVFQEMQCRYLNG